MGKKGKKGSSSKKGSASKKGSPKKGKKGKKSEPEGAKKPAIDAEALRELTKGLVDVFRFANGDAYAGHFAVTRDGGVVRDGWGSYFSADGAVAAGRWAGDALAEADRARWPGGAWYRGAVDAGGRFHGAASYGAPPLGRLDGRFEAGRPAGLVTLVDHGGHRWQGLAGEGGARLLPRNHFFDSEDEFWRGSRLVGRGASLASAGPSGGGASRTSRVSQKSVDPAH